jgi:3',5'-cyclic-AMP phosphodiesterase
MKRIVWLTDIHLNFLMYQGVNAFLAEVAVARPDVVLISGDIGESHNVCDYLNWISETLAVPIYFVLGNHDFYFGSIVDTRVRVRKLCATNSRLCYLSYEEFIELTPEVALVGHDGWADGRLGNYERSLVVMQDSKLIAELSPLDKLARWDVLKRLADEAADHLQSVLPLALAAHREVFVLTHVPPFLEACWHEGQLSNEQWLPHFTCDAVGQTILDVMRSHPEKRLTVLCGHTHGSGECNPLENVQVITGGAEYGKPQVTRVFEVQ